MFKRIKTWLLDHNYNALLEKSVDEGLSPAEFQTLENLEHTKKHGHFGEHF